MATNLGQLLRINEVDDLTDWINGTNELELNDVEWPAPLMVLILDGATVLDSIPVEELPEGFKQSGRIVIYRLRDGSVLEMSEGNSEFSPEVYYYSAAEWRAIEEHAAELLNAASEAS